MRYSKKILLDIVARVLFPEYGDKTLIQINMEKTLLGEKTFDITPESLKDIGNTAWLFGFVANHCNNEELVHAFEIGLKSNWYYSKFDEDFESILSEFCLDVILSNHELFKTVTEYVFSKRINDEFSRNTFKLAYGTGLIDISMDEIMELKKIYVDNK